MADQVSTRAAISALAVAFLAGCATSGQTPPHPLTVATCVRWWNQNGYVSALGAYRQYVDHASVQVIAIGSRSSCVYSFHLSDPLGGTNQWLQVSSSSENPAPGGYDTINGNPAGADSSADFQLMNARLRRRRRT